MDESIVKSCPNAVKNVKFWFPTKCMYFQMNLKRDETASTTQNKNV